MAGEPVVTIVGNLTRDPELRFTSSGVAVADFSVAMTPRSFDRSANEWRDGDTQFYRCSVWRDAAENVAETLRKGMRVIVQGRLRQRSYETREGERRTVFEVEVDEVGPSLRYASAQVTRKSANGGNGGGNYGGQQQNQGGNNFGGGNQGGFGGNQSAPQQSAPSNDPWNSAPQAGSFGGADAEPPF